MGIAAAFPPIEDVAAPATLDAPDLAAEVAVAIAELIPAEIELARAVAAVEMEEATEDASDKTDEAAEVADAPAPSLVEKTVDTSVVSVDESETT